MADKAMASRIVVECENGLQLEIVARIRNSKGPGFMHPCQLDEALESKLHDALQESARGWSKVKKAVKPKAE